MEKRKYTKKNSSYWKASGSKIGRPRKVAATQESNLDKIADTIARKVVTRVSELLNDVS